MRVNGSEPWDLYRGDSERILCFLCSHTPWFYRQEAIETLDIGLIRDEANIVVPRRGPQIEAASRSPISSRVTPSSGSTVVPLSRVHKLEAHMATLLHHVKPWMQWSIAEFEARMERSDTTKDTRAKKRERQQNEQARRASILDEELRQQRVREGTLGASSSIPTTEAMTTVRDDVSTIDGVVRVIDSTTESAVLEDVSTTEGGPSIDPVDSGKPDSPAC
uniref:Integrase core domain containing protein n=1 Tax=Solanum tuberosum TaxID=4113 RepID=M1DMD2_SOLTU